MKNSFCNNKQLLTHQVLTLSSIKIILETIFSNDSDINGSHERNGAILFAYIIFFSLEKMINN